jgi:hypothetical protein
MTNAPLWPDPLSTHTHGTHCYWDVLGARWVCGSEPVAAADEGVSSLLQPEQPAPRAAGAAPSS